MKKGINMKKQTLKRRAAFVLAVVMAFTMSFTGTVFAADDDTYLTLGADLSKSEKATVLDFFGLDSTDGYNVTYVTNAEEYQYLSSYVDSSRIGDRALSSVLIRENGSNEIDVETHNINYCTKGMYINALASAGVSGADVIVAGPFEISGTAALVGTIKAYEQMTGEEVSDEVIEGCVDELTTTGDLGEEIGDTDAAEGIIAAVKEELADNPDMSAEEIAQAVRDAAEKAGVELSEATVQKIVNMLQNLQGLDIDWDNIAKQSSSILEKFSGLFDSGQAQGFFERIVNWFKGLFS